MKKLLEKQLRKKVEEEEKKQGFDGYQPYEGMELFKSAGQMRKEKLQKKQANTFKTMQTQSAEDKDNNTKFVSRNVTKQMQNKPAKSTAAEILQPSEEEKRIKKLMDDKIAN